MSPTYFRKELGHEELLCEAKAGRDTVQIDCIKVSVLTLEKLWNATLEGVFLFPRAVLFMCLESESESPPTQIL